MQQSGQPLSVQHIRCKNILFCLSKMYANPCIFKEANLLDGIKMTENWLEYDQKI